MVQFHECSKSLGLGDISEEREFEFEKLSMFDQSQAVNSWPHSLSIRPGDSETAWDVDHRKRRVNGKYLWRTPSLRIRGFGYDPW